METPKYLYKYKGIRTKEDLIRIIDIIENHRIYMPKYDELNDPLEGQIVDIKLLGYAGAEMMRAADKEDVVVKKFKKEYGIVSLTDTYNSPLLWAHYANDYEGVCLCFSTKKAFCNSLPLEYCKERIETRISSDNNMNLYKLVKESFLKKNSDWSYEKEWRIVERKCSEKYLQFEPNELCAVIFGHNLSDEIKDFLIVHLDENVKKYKTYIGYRTFGIRILDYDYKYIWAGCDIESVDLEKELDTNNNKIFK